MGSHYRARDWNGRRLGYRFWDGASIDHAGNIRMTDSCSIWGSLISGASSYAVSSLLGRYDIDLVSDERDASVLQLSISAPFSWSGITSWSSFTVLSPEIGDSSVIGPSLFFVGSRPTALTPLAWLGVQGSRSSSLPIPVGSTVIAPVSDDSDWGLRLDPGDAQQEGALMTGQIAGGVVELSPTGPEDAAGN
jgi:hypothetical protein